MFNFNDVFGKKQKILFVMAHPDDVDVFFGGVMGQLLQSKKEVRVLLTTAGARGSRENDIEEKILAKQRLAEEANALGILGLGKANISSLNYKDGEVENNWELIGKLAKTIRSFKPDLVATHDPSYYYHELFKTGEWHVNHRDHRHTGLSVIDAVYPFARDKNFFPDQIKSGLDIHNVYDLLLTGFAGHNTEFDITNFAQKKREALLAHKSQMAKENVDWIMKMHRKGKKFVEYGKYLKLRK